MRARGLGNVGGSLDRFDRDSNGPAELTPAGGSVGLRALVLIG
jgi:hypothetical protein